MPAITIQISEAVDRNLHQAAADLQINWADLAVLAIEAFLAQKNMVEGTTEIIRIVEAKHGNAG